MSWLTMANAFARSRKMEHGFSPFSTAFIILVCKSSTTWFVDLPLWKLYWFLYRIFYLEMKLIFSASNEDGQDRYRSIVWTQHLCFTIVNRVDYSDFNLSRTIPSQKRTVNICNTHSLICSDECFTGFGEIPYMLLAFLVFMVFNNFCTSAAVSLRKKTTSIRIL